MSSTRSREWGARQQQLIDHYLADLRRSLTSVDPEEAADTEESVREHLEVALASVRRPTVADVQTVLDELGPVQRIAEVSSERTAEPTWSRWVGPVGVLALTLLGLVLSGFWFLGLPIGLCAVVTGALLDRRATGAVDRLYRLATVLGAAAVVLSLLIGLVLIPVTSG